MKPIRNPFIAFISLGAGLLALTQTASADSFYWDANPAAASNQNGSGSWTSDVGNTNWTALPGGTPNISWVGGPGNTAFIGNASGTGYSNPATGGTITLDQSISLFSLSMSSGQTGSYVVNGIYNLELSGTGPTVGNNSTTANLTINAGVIGTSGLKKINGGRVILGGENTYTGVTAVTAGTLQMSRQVALYFNNNASWTAANIVVSSGATLSMNVGGFGEFTSADINLLGALGGTADGFVSGSFLGLDTSNADLGVFTHSSVIANPNGGSNILGLTKLGANTLVLSGTNTYSGGTRLFGGTIGIGNDSALGSGTITTNNSVGLFASDAARSIANKIFLSATGSSVLTVSGTQNLTINGSITGSGTRYVSTTLLPADGFLTVAGNVYLAESSTSSQTFTFGSTSAAGSPGKVLVTGTVNNNEFTNTLASNLRVNGGGTVVLAGTNTYTGTTTVENSNTVLQVGNGGTTGNLGAGNVSVTTGSLEFNHSDTYAVGNVLTGSGTYRQVGSGTTVLSATNTHSGLTTITGGTLQISNPSALGTTAGSTNISSAAGRLALSGGITVAENITINARNSGDHLLNVSGDNILSGILTWNSGGTAYGVRSDSGKLTLNGPVSPLLGSKTLNVSGAGDVEFPGNIANTATVSSTLSLAKTGAGTLTLKGANIYTGASTVTEGTLALVGGSQSSPITVGSGAFLGFTLGLPTTSTSTVDLTVGAVKITGTPAPSTSYTLMTASSITGTPVLAAPIAGYVLAVEGGNVLKLNFTGGGNTYADWLAANSPATGFVTDSDNDGVSNGLENVLGTNPNTYSAGLTQISATGGSATFQHTLNPTIASDVSYGYRWSTDLVEWKASAETNSGGTTATITSSAPVAGVVTVTTTINSGPAGKIFVRLHAAQP
ncbi:MAG: autotransporter-associated beta strand repeat-containing protein [Luteolibacter sp.]|uniref:beta strand repeat-containing protein n=1 Tax=Luteolibacter sp. TaxID=1962973 RepID=UPI003265D1E1